MVNAVPLAVARPVAAAPPTTVWERALLMFVVVLMPMENMFRLFGMVSVPWLLFGLMATAALVARPRLLLEVAAHPVFVAAWCLVIVMAAVEFVQPYSDLDDVQRTFQMFVGGVLVACLCRDRPALRAALYAYLIAGLWLCLVIFLTSYRVLDTGAATDFNTASRLRREAFADNPLQANLNRMAFIAAQGAVVALTLALTSRASMFRNLCIFASAFCLVGAWLPVSRSGIAIAVITCGILLLANRRRFMRGIAVAMVLVAGVAFFVPSAVYARLTMAPQARGRISKVEGRTKVYTAAIASIPEYAGTGVGSGHFWASWGRAHGFEGSEGKTLGAHNVFLQVWICWGVVGLGFLLLLLWQVARAVPRVGVSDPLAFSLYGLAITVLLVMFARHSTYSKEYSLMLGLIVGSRRFIFPSVRQLRNRAHLWAQRFHARLTHQPVLPPVRSPATGWASPEG